MNDFFCGSATTTTTTKKKKNFQARILKRTAKGGKEIADTDTFIVNEDFQHRHYKIRVNGTQMNETEDEAKSTTERVFQDRSYSIDACVVRTMKSRKTVCDFLYHLMYLFPDFFLSSKIKLLFFTKTDGPLRLDEYRLLTITVSSSGK